MSLAGKRTSLDEVRTSLDGVRTSLDGVRTSFGGVRTSFGGVRTSFGGVRTSFGGVRTSFGGVRMSLGGVRTSEGSVHVSAGVRWVLGERRISRDDWPRSGSTGGASGFASTRDGAFSVWFDGSIAVETGVEIGPWFSGEVDGISCNRDALGDESTLAKGYGMASGGTAAAARGRTGIGLHILLDFNSG